MYEKERYVQAFEQECKLNDNYSRSDLEEFLGKHNLPVYNITAFTYNRWNRGMDSLNPLFEWSDGGKYKYKGRASQSNYTGKVYHYPQEENQIYIIANWKSGNLEFLNNIKSFEEWNESDFDGDKFVRDGSKVIVDYNGKRMKWIIDDEHINYQMIKSDSPLGQAIYGKKEGDEFQIGNNKGVIIQID